VNTSKAREVAARALHRGKLGSAAVPAQRPRPADLACLDRQPPSPVVNPPNLPALLALCLSSPFCDCACALQSLWTPSLTSISTSSSAACSCPGASHCPRAAVRCPPSPSPSSARLHPCHQAGLVIAAGSAPTTPQRLPPLPVSARQQTSSTRLLPPIRLARRRRPSLPTCPSHPSHQPHPPWSPTTVSIAHSSARTSSWMTRTATWVWKTVRKARRHGWGQI